MNGSSAAFAAGIAAAALSCAGCAVAGGEDGGQASTIVQIDSAAQRRPISALIYGVNWASTQQLDELNAPLNRFGGNATSRYNWRENASNRARDWYFQSTPWPDPTPGEAADSFIRSTRAASAQAMLTIPTLGWVARLGEGRAKRASFSITKYGAQTGNDARWFADAGNGIRPDGTFITGNDPRDANLQVDASFQRGWLAHLTQTWGRADAGGLRYYILDNEPSIWHSTHRDVQPTGATMQEVRDRIVAHAATIKDADPGAQIVAPEEWGWTGYFRSGFDMQWGARYGWYDPLPDRAANANRPYLPWLLDELRMAHERGGRRLLDVFSVHFYPQGGESSDDVSVTSQQLRNRSTRSLWDPAYRDESWIDDQVRLIPRLREWVATHYPGTAIGITEYDWGAEQHISGAIAQADVLGIFGREGVDLATRWEAPALGSPVYNAMRMYRNVDGAKAGFGDVSVAASVPDPDRIAAFAAERGSDAALTVIVINKQLADAARVQLRIANFAVGDAVQRWELTASNRITRMPDEALQGQRLDATLPAQSITLFVISAALPRAGRATPPIVCCRGVSECRPGCKAP